jgi:hypothetical protein
MTLPAVQAEASRPQSPVTVAGPLRILTAFHYSSSKAIKAQQPTKGKRELHGSLPSMCDE